MKVGFILGLEHQYTFVCCDLILNRAIKNLRRPKILKVLILLKVYAIEDVSHSEKYVQ